VRPRRFSKPGRSDKSYADESIHPSLAARRLRLWWARLQEANLAAADLRRANLDGAILQDADLEGATLERGTVMPEGWEDVVVCKP
jgi:uncharacterized protein YjbI with pentapeptide repeats